MKIFEISKNLKAVCESEKTRYGFRHLATLLIDGNEVDTAKCCYYNRTWESFEFESVLETLLEKTKALDDKEKKVFAKYIKNGGRVKDDLKPLKTISMVMAMGDLLAGDSKKEKNDWKARMLKAGLENKGLIMPEDWNELSENDKEKRLNNVINTLK